MKQGLMKFFFLLLLLMLLFYLACTPSSVDNEEVKLGGELNDSTEIIFDSDWDTTTIRIYESWQSPPGDPPTPKDSVQ